MKVIRAMNGDLLLIGPDSVIIKEEVFEGEEPINYWSITYKSRNINYSLADGLTKQQADALLEKLFILIASRDKTLIRISEWLKG